MFQTNEAILYDDCRDSYGNSCTTYTLADKENVLNIYKTKKHIEHV